jgi:hypothetical protein
MECSFAPSAPNKRVLTGECCRAASPMTMGKVNISQQRSPAITGIFGLKCSILLTL